MSEQAASKCDECGKFYRPADAPISPNRGIGIDWWFWAAIIGGTLGGIWAAGVWMALR